VADCMQCTRVSYHFAVRKIERDEDLIVRGRIASVLIEGPSCNFWAAIKFAARKVLIVVPMKPLQPSYLLTNIEVFILVFLLTLSRCRDILHELDSRVSDGGIGKAEYSFNRPFSG
jgi:hypothetical protein